MGRYSGKADDNRGFKKMLRNVKEEANDRKRSQ